MIEIHPLRDKDKLSVLYNQAKLDMNEHSIAVVASDGDEALGYCLFDMNDDNLLVHCLSPQDDIMFADGLLRSALHVGVENGVNKAFYSVNAPVELFRKLRFIKDDSINELNVQLLFSSCENC